MRSWPDHLVWMRVEGDHGDRQPTLGGDGHGAADDALVAPVHTVEDADRHDRRAPAVGHVVQSLPAQHLKVPPATASAARCVPAGGSAARADPSLPRDLWSASDPAAWDAACTRSGHEDGHGGLALAASRAASGSRRPPAGDPGRQARSAAAPGTRSAARQARSRPRRTRRAGPGRLVQAAGPGRRGQCRAACHRARARRASSSVRSRRGNAAAAASASGSDLQAAAASWSRVRAVPAEVGADPGAAQRGEVAAHAERGTQVAGDRADVGAAGAGDRARRRPGSRRRPAPRRPRAC